MSNAIPEKHIILILGASGFVGNSLYKELLSYFKTYGTYCTQEGSFRDNQVFFKYDVVEDNLAEILKETNPSVIISSLRGDYKAQFYAHSEIANYVQAHHHCRLLFLSSVEVFDGLYAYPSYEGDSPKAESNYGRHKLSIERLLLETIPAQTTILRLPLVLGATAPEVIQLIQAGKNKAAFEVYPNLIISVSTADKIAQQVHYIINKGLDGIFHLASEDVIHHEDLFKELTEKLGIETPVFKNVYHRNEESYQAILPKKNRLPNPYRITVSEVIDSTSLHEEIVTTRS